jgi:hypothetical protein
VAFPAAMGTRAVIGEYAMTGVVIIPPPAHR